MQSLGALKDYAENEAHRADKGRLPATDQKRD
jgi:hypothetical protein